ncbi:MAG: AEC family transporter [Bacilli bacterium]|jgi:predicted permease|nr:AEC family transporter [Bacilli bacterium]
MDIFAAVSISDNIAKAMSSTSLWTAIAKTIIIILLGFFLTKLKIFPQGTGKTLTKVVMNVALPCLAFTSFMVTFTTSGGVDALVNFIFGFVIYIIFIFLGRAIFLWIKDPTKRLVLSVLFAFGSTTFFAQPLISAIFGKQAYNDSNMLNVAYRVFLYSYAYLAVSGTKIGQTPETSFKATMKKIFLNPIIIATFAGLILWVLQAIPGSYEQNWWTLRTDWLAPVATGAEIKYVPFWRFDVSLPWIHQTAAVLGGLSSPLVWLAIGCTLGGVSFKEAALDKFAWIYSGLKVFLAPAFVLALLYGVEAIATACGYPALISVYTVESSVMMWMVPPATVAVAYCINFEKEKVMASDISLVSTFVAIPGIVFWVLILTVIAASGFFPA